MEENKIPTDLIIRYLSNEATTDENDQLLNWVAKDAENQKVFTEWTEAWNYQFPYHSSFDVSKGLITLNQRVDEYESSAANRTTFPWARMAVITLIASVSITMVTAIYREASSYVQYSEFRTSSSVDSVELADGSKVILNVNSSIKYPTQFLTTSREVTLKGEAFFKVKKDPSRPFIVTAGDLRTEVLGTSFNILTTPDNSTVSVASGRVKVSDGADAIILKPNEKVTHSNRGGKMISSESNLLELSWMDNSINFHDTRLSDVIRALSKRYNTQITLGNEILNGCVITGKFKDESIEEVLAAICFSTGSQFRKEDDQFVLYGPGCAE